MAVSGRVNNLRDRLRVKLFSRNRTSEQQKELSHSVQISAMTMVPIPAIVIESIGRIIQEFK